MTSDDILSNFQGQSSDRDGFESVHRYFAGRRDPHTGRAYIHDDRREHVQNVRPGAGEIGGRTDRAG